MKALSLTQPWASLIAIGAKRIETRSWPTAYRGPVAIHASKGFPAWARETCWEDRFRDALVEAGLADFGGDSDLVFDSAERFALPLGALVAVGRLEDCVRTEALIERHRRGRCVLLPHEIEFGDYSAGRWAWILADVTRLAEPISCKGALGLWDVPADIAKQLGAR